MLNRGVVASSQLSFELLPQNSHLMVGVHGVGWREPQNATLKEFQLLWRMV